MVRERWSISIRPQETGTYIDESATYLEDVRQQEIFNEKAKAADRSERMKAGRGRGVWVVVRGWVFRL